MILTLAVLVVALAPVIVSTDDLFGTTQTLKGAGLTSKIIELGMIEMPNMDIGTQDWSEGEDEGTKEEKKGRTEKKFVTHGHNAYPETFQHQAALIVNTSNGYFQICGAVLVDGRHAITAAHCMTFMSGNVTFDHFIAVAIHNRTLGLLNPGSQMVPVDYAFDHHNYGEDENGYPNDISVVHFAEEIVENKHVHFAELAKPEMGSFEHHFCVVSGWGLSENGRPDLLQFGYQYIPSFRDCKLFWAILENNGISRRHVCGYYYPTSGCFGDSGGPLTCGDVVVGLVSWGVGSCSGCLPTIYTRVSSYYHWIQNTID